MPQSPCCAIVEAFALAMNKTPILIEELRGEIQTAAAAELPSIRGQLAMLEAEILVRLTTPHQNGASDEDVDTLIDVKEVAERLKVSERYVRKHSDELGRVSMPGSPLRFSSKKLNSIIKRRGYGLNN